MSEFSLELENGLIDFGQHIEHEIAEVVHPHDTQLSDELKRGLPHSLHAVETQARLPDQCRYRTFNLLAASGPIELSLQGIKRYRMVITLLAGGPLTIGPDNTVKVLPGNTGGVGMVLSGVGSTRVITHTDRVFAVTGVDNTTFDVQEEYYGQ
jgi:hypothetical protein